MVVAVAVTVALVVLDNNPQPPPFIAQIPPAEPETYISLETDEIQHQDEEEETEEDAGNLFRPPARTNFLFVGLDLNLLTDAIMVGTFYRDTGNIHLMSIPRDTRAQIPPHRMEQMRADGLRPPQTLRINAMRSIGGREHGIHYLKAQLGEMLGVQFHYYVEVELDAFRRIVDAIGGVEMYIPRHLFYEDPYQDLFINIPPGTHHLDGRMAEGVVRFRSFPTGDLMRNEMQMEFMNQLIRQVLTREAIMNNPLALFNLVINDVNTNAGLDALRFLPYIGNINADGIKTFTMPGHVGYIGGGSFFIPGEQELISVVNQVFYYFPGMNDEDDMDDNPDALEDEAVA